MLESDLSLFVNGVRYSDNTMNYKLVERMNQVPFLEASFYDIQGDNPDIVFGKSIAVKSELADSKVLGWFSFRGTNIDSSLYGRNSTINETYASLASDRFGVVNNAYLLDNVDIENKIYVPNSSNLFESGELTFSMWFNPSVVTPNAYIWCHYNWRFYISGDKLSFGVGRMNNSTGPSHSVTTTTSIVAGNWYNVVGVYRPDPVGGNGYIKIYLNGVLEGTVSFGTSVIWTDYGNKDLQWGNSNHGAAVPFNGIIGESIIFGKELSTNEINILQNLNKQLPLNNYVSQKFMITEVGDKSDDYVDIKSEGWVERKLHDFLVVKTASADVSSQAGRPQYNNIPVNTIVNQQLASYSTGVLAGTLITDQINIRSESDKLVSFFYGVGDVSGVDTFGSYSPDLSTSYINLTTRGSDKSSTIILNASGPNQNCEASERKQQFDILKNSLKVYGYGDGINQLESVSFHATSIRNKLASPMTETQNTAVLVNSSGFPNNGSVWIGCEKCNYTGRSGNTLTGLTRGVAFQGNVSKPYAHAVNSPVYNGAYTDVAPQNTGNGSSINTHGIKMDSFELKEIIDQSTLDIVAEKLLLERKGNGVLYEPPEAILVYPEDYDWATVNIGVGDEITINDTDAGLTGKYRVYGKTLVNDSGVVSLELEVSNTTLSVLSEIRDDADKGVTLSKYMQGATNIYCIPFAENIDSTNPGYLRFYLPEETVAVNRLKLNFKMENYRADSKSVITQPYTKNSEVSWMNGGKNYYKGGFVTRSNVISNLAANFRPNVVTDLTLNSSTRVNSVTANFTQNYLVGNSSSGASIQVQKIVQNWSNNSVAKCSIGTGCVNASNINSYSNGPYWAPFNSSGWNFRSAVTSISTSSGSVITSGSWTNANLVSSLAFDSGSVLNGYQNIVWDYPFGNGILDLPIYVNSDEKDKFQKAIIKLTFNNQYYTSPTTFLIRLQQYYDGTWNNIASLSGTNTGGLSKSIYVERTKAQFPNYETSGYADFRFVVESSGDYNANRSDTPDLSSISLSVVLYYKSYDELEYGVVKNNSEFTPPGTIVLKIAKDGSAETTIGTYTSNQNGLNISNPSASWKWEPGNWYYLKFDSNHANNSLFGGRMRIESNLYTQIYINSR